jgi:retinoid hydroxylase
MSPTSSLPLPPGNFGLPFIGETPKFLSDPDFVIKRRQQHGVIFKTNILNRPTAIMSGIEANKFILSTHFHKFSWQDGWPKSFQELLGASLFLQEGAEHQRNRRLMMPAFHGKALGNYVNVMAEITDRYCQQWFQQGEITWFNEFKQLTFSIASTLLIGASPQDNSIPQLSQWFTELTNGLFALPFKIPGSTYTKALQARNNLLIHVENVIQSKQNHPGEDVLGLLMQSMDEDGSSLSIEELKVQAILLLFAGHETTTSLITSFCMVVAQRPDILAQLRAEQDSVNLDLPLNLELLKQMTVLDRTIKEVERLYPPIGGGFRGVVEEFEFNGCRVPAGWQVLYRIAEAHLDSDIFPNSTEFDIDRHHERAPDFSLVTYGGGPRVCIGLAFAQMEMKIIASKLLRNYSWELLPEQNLAMKAIPTLHPHDGLKIKFAARE